MRGTVWGKAWILAVLGVVAAVLLLGGSSSRPEPATAASPGAAVSPILSCPNVDGSAGNKVLIPDILAVVQAYFKDYPIAGSEPAGTSDYVPMYDLNGVYNPQTGLGGQQRIDDILAVVNAYFDVCPLVDTQVAQATSWAMDVDGNPGNGMQPVPQIENEAAIEALGYYRGTNDVPGQGVHYVNNQNWDGVFDPAAPEGLVYNNGRLAAQLYVTDAPTVGLGTHAPNACFTQPTPSGCPGKIDGIDLEPPGTGPDCNPACSWIGAEKWHLHYYLCTVNIGTTGAIAIPGSFIPAVGNSLAACDAYSDSQTNPDAPECTIPVTTQPCYSWGQTAGWMGHLYNWFPNANRVADVNATMNGRFGDCYPDVEGWKATNCPG